MLTALQHLTCCFASMDKWEVRSALMIGRLSVPDLSCIIIQCV